MGIILGITGHRPSVLNYDYDINHNDWYNIRSNICDKILELNVTKIISGMALGTDQLCVSIAIELQIPFIAAVPFKGQESVWPYKSKALYKDFLSAAEEVVFVGQLNSNKSNFSELMQLRNEWIVNNSDEMLAVWNGDKKGGTYNAITYAKQNNKSITIINPFND